MKKVLFALDDHRFSKKAFEFICRINKMERVLVVGLYVPAFISDLAWSTPEVSNALLITQFTEEDEAMMRENTAAFSEACINNGIEFRTHGDVADTILEGLKKETRFADLLIIGYEHYYQASKPGYVHEQLRQIIEHTECPILLVPEDASFPDSIVIAYDGTKESIYAMKQFCYLFPQMREEKTDIVFVEPRDNSIPEEDYLKELAARHFSNLTISELNFEKSYFSMWIVDRPTSLVVTGAYGRTEISQLFKKSFITQVLRDNIVPVFIAHH